MSIGSKLKDLRTRKKVSLQELATAVQASKAHIWDIERGASQNPSLDLLKRIADYFQVGVGELAEENPNAEGEPQELIAMYRGLKELSPADLETVNMLVQRLKTTRSR